MYLIANATSSFVELADLGVSLKPKQALDLHAMGYKGKAEVSANLKKAIKNGWVKVLKVDKPTATNKEVIKERIIERSNDGNKEEMLGSIRKIIQEEMKNIKIDNSNNIPSNLLETLSELIKSGGIKQNSDNNISEDDGVDIGKMQEIHTKVAEKVMKGASSSVNYEEKNVKDASMKSNISELEDLI